MFNNLAIWEENKFVSELKRAYKFKRGVYCHIEDNSPKYRMVGNDVGLESQTYRSFKFWYRDFCLSLRANAKQSRETVITRSDKRRSNRIHLIPHLEIKDFGPPASGGHGSYHCLTNVVNRLRNKCAMTCDLFPRPFGERVRERGYLVASLLSRLAAFTLAEVLITLGIIGVVAALTLPSLVQNYRKSVVENKLKASYSIISNAVKMAEVENGMGFDFTISDEYKDENDVNNFSAKQSEAIFNTYFKSYFKVVKEYSKKDNNKFDYYGQKGGKIDDVAVTGKCFELTNGTAMCFVARGGTVGHFLYI